jgi:putative peptidoglycan lipid II flippase
MVTNFEKVDCDTFKNEDTAKSAVKYAGIVSFATLLSRISGLFRDQVIAAKLLTSLSDPFFIALRISNFLRAIFAEGALSAAYIPIFSDTLVKNGKTKAKDFFSSTFTLLCIATTVISIIGIIFSPLIIKITAWGWSELYPQKQALASSLLKIMFPYLFFISIAAIFMGTLNSMKQFFMPAFSSVFLNISEIGGLFIGYYFFNSALYGLAWGVIVGGLLQVISQGYVLLKKKFLPRFTRILITPDVKRVFELTTTAAVGLSIFQINSLLDNCLASFLEDGSVSYLNYGNRLMQFPLAFFAVSLVMAYFPLFSRTVSLGNIYELKRQAREVSDMISFTCFPSMVSMIFLACPIIDIIYKHGEFDKSSLYSTALVLICYILGLWSNSVGKLYIRICHALCDMKTPKNTGIYCVVINFVLNVILMQFISYAGLALATSIASTVQLYLISRTLERKIGAIKEREFDSKFIKFIIASGIMTMFFVFTSAKFYNLDGSSMSKVWNLSWILLVGWGLYFLSVKLMGCPEPDMISKILLKQGKGK